MYIEFNIELNGKHFFATTKRSCTNSEQAKVLNKVLQAKFPESQGYRITASMDKQCMYGIDLDKDLSIEVNSILTNL
jgi:hypothetical protein